jgi:hypothetical protein
VSRAEPSRAGPSWAELGRAELSRAGLSRAEPSWRGPATRRARACACALRACICMPLASSWARLDVRAAGAGTPDRQQQEGAGAQQLRHQEGGGADWQLEGLLLEQRDAVGLVRAGAHRRCRSPSPLPRRACCIVPRCRPRGRPPCVAPTLCPPRHAGLHMGTPGASRPAADIAHATATFPAFHAPCARQPASPPASPPAATLGASCLPAFRGAHPEQVHAVATAGGRHQQAPRAASAGAPAAPAAA